jgi:hypothetical protein
MASVNSIQVDAIVAKTNLLPIDRHPKFRLHYFQVAAATVAAADGSTFELGRLPFGRLRILRDQSKIWTSAWGSSRVLKFGHRAYAKADGSAEAEDDDAFGSALDVSSATNALQMSTGTPYDMFSRTGWDFFATVTGGTFPVGGTLEGYLAYLHE